MSHGRAGKGRARVGRQLQQHPRPSRRLPLRTVLAEKLRPERASTCLPRAIYSAVVIAGEKPICHAAVLLAEVDNQQPDGEYFEFSSIYPKLERSGSYILQFLMSPPMPVAGALKTENMFAVAPGPAVEFSLQVRLYAEHHTAWKCRGAACSIAKFYSLAIVK